MPKIILKNFLHSPFALQLCSLSFLLLFFTGFHPTFDWQDQTIFMGEGQNVFENQYFPLSESGFLENMIGVNTAVLNIEEIVDEEGNVVKKVVPKKRDSVLEYAVKKNDNISKIARRFGLKVSTVLWANNLNMKQAINPGDALKIPPTDGVYYTVKKNETLSEIAESHAIEMGKILAYNRIKEAKVKTGQEIFLPEARKVFIAEKKPEPAPRTFFTSRKNSKTSPSKLPTSKSVSSLGIRLRRPTKGVLTQRYHSGHYAIDVANKRNTPIYAAADGVVIEELHSGWNYGYGRYLIIDHGNNIQTLYAHNQRTKVDIGQKVKKGELVALMGNTGNVFGRTGIHLHFELRINGRKVNPYNYFE